MGGQTGRAPTELIQKFHRIKWHSCTFHPVPGNNRHLAPRWSILYAILRGISGPTSFSIAACHAILFRQDFGAWETQKASFDETETKWRDLITILRCSGFMMLLHPFNCRPAQRHQKATGEPSKKTMYMWVWDDFGGTQNICKQMWCKNATIEKEKREWDWYGWK